MAVQSNTLDIIWTGVTMKKKWWKKQAKAMATILSELDEKLGITDHQTLVDAGTADAMRTTLSNFYTKRMKKTQTESQTE